MENASDSSHSVQMLCRNWQDLSHKKCWGGLEASRWETSWSRSTRQGTTNDDAYLNWMYWWLRVDITLKPELDQRINTSSVVSVRQRQMTQITSILFNALIISFLNTMLLMLFDQPGCSILSQYIRPSIFPLSLGLQLDTFLYLIYFCNDTYKFGTPTDWHIGSIP